MTKDTICALIMARADIREDVKRELCNAINGNAATPDAAWGTLLSSLMLARRALKSNRTKWPEYLRPLYEEYTLIMERVYERISRGARIYEHPRDAQAAAKTALVTKLRLEGPTKGRILPLALPVRNGLQWPTWVPPAIASDFCQRVEAAYVRNGHLKGKKFTPFVTPSVRAYAHGQVERMYATLASIRRAARTDGGVKMSAATGNTPYRALILTAVRMAEREITQIKKELDAGTRPLYAPGIPVNWLALLTPEMRTRMREGAKNPASVTTQGLDSYYAPVGLPTDEPSLPDAGDDEGE